MKRILLQLHVLALVLILSVPISAFAVDPASNLSASLSNGKLMMSFTKGTGTSGYLLLKKQGWIVPGLTTLPTLTTGVNYTLGSVLPTLNGWEVVTNTTNLTESLELQSGFVTYLLYMRDSNNRYSGYKSIFINSTENDTFNGPLSHDLYIFNGDFTATVFKATQVKPTQTLAILKGKLFIKDKLEVEGLLTVSSGVNIDSNTGGNSLFIREKGRFSLATHYSVSGQHDFHVEKDAILDILPGATIETSSGNLYWQDGAIVNVHGTFNAYRRDKISIHANSKITFFNGGKLNVYSNLTIPKAIWNTGSTLAYYGDSNMDTYSTGFNQEFHNLIWNTPDTRFTKFTLDSGIKIKGDLIIETTGGKTLSLESTGSISIGGKVSVPATTTLILPKNTTINGDLTNNGTLTFTDLTGSLVVEGKLTVGNGGVMSLPKETSVRGDFVYAGTVNGNEVLNLGNSLQLNSGGVFDYPTLTKREIFFRKKDNPTKSVLALSTGKTAANAVQKITIEEGRLVDLNSDIELSNAGIFSVETGATLDLGLNVVKNATSATQTVFELKDNATLKIANIGGIATGQAGAIRTTTRSLSTNGHYIFNGTSAQNTGNALPTTIEGSLTIDNPVSVVLTSNTIIKKLLHLNKGNLNISGKYVTLYGSLTVGTGTLTGTRESGMWIENNDDKLSVTLPAVTLGTLDVEVDATMFLAGDLTIYDWLRMRGGVLKTQRYKVNLLESASMMESATEIADGFVMGTVETEQATGTTNRAYSFSGIGLTIKYNGNTSRSTKVQRVTGEISSSSKKEVLVNRVFTISTPEPISGLDASIEFQYMKHELKPLLKLEEGNMALYRSKDRGANYEKLTGSVVNVSKSTITLSGIDKFSFSATDVTSKQMAMPTGSQVLGLSVSKTSNAVTPMADEPVPSRFGAGTPDPDNSPITPLPVALVSFTASVNQNGAASLAWATASEKDNSHFEVQRSANGQQWSAVGQVRGKGTASQMTAYNFTDSKFAQISTPVVYYRLKQVDFNGKVEFSKTIAVEQKNTRSQINSISINPTTGNLEVRYTNLDVNQPLYLVLANLNGRTLVNKRFKLTETSGVISVPVSAAARGVLVAKASCGSVFLSAKFIK